MVKQWNSLSDDWVTILSTTSRAGLSCSQRVMLSPICSRSAPARAEPMLHVGEAAHRPPLDFLLLAELARRHAGIDAVGEPVVALALGLDDGRRMHAGGGAEGVSACEGIVDGQRVAGGAGGGLGKAYQRAHVPC